MTYKLLSNNFSLLIAAATLTATLSAQPAADFVSFDRFMEATKDINSTVMNRAESKVRDGRTFEQMRRHIINLYSGVHVSHSYVSDGSHFDCIPVEQQPAVRMLGL